MVYQVVNFVVAVDKCSSILWLRLRIAEERNNFIEVRDFAHRYFRFDVDSLGLRCRDRAKGLDLTIIESGRSSKVSKTNRAGVDAMKLGESTDGIMPPRVRKSCLGDLEGRRSHFVPRIR